MFIKEVVAVTKEEYLRGRNAEAENYLLQVEVERLKEKAEIREELEEANFILNRRVSEMADALGKSLGDVSDLEHNNNKLEEENTQLKARLFEAEKVVAESLFEDLHEAVLAEVDKNFPTKVYRGVRHA